MKELIHLLTTNTRAIFFVFICIVAVQLGTYEFLYARANWITPQGHVHTMENVDAYYPDVIRQGKMGEWAHTYSLTTLPTPKIYTYLFFITAGKFAALFDIDPVTMYEITRVVGGVLVLCSTYWLITLLLPVSMWVVAMFFTMVCETGPAWQSVLNTPFWQWTAALPFQAIIARHFGLSHHLWSEAFGLILLCLIILATRKINLYLVLGIIFFSIAGPLCNPTFFLIFITCLFPIWILYTYVTKGNKHIYFPIFLSTISIVCAGLFTKSQFLVGPPWNAVIAAEKSWWTTEFILVPFLQSFVLFYPFVAILLVLLPFTWKFFSPAMKKLCVLTLSWSTLPVGLIVISALPWVPLVNGRIASDLSSIPIGLVSTVCVYAAFQMPFAKKAINYFIYMLLAICMIFSIALSIRFHIQTLSDQIDSIDNKGNSFTLYPTKTLWEGMMALKNTPAWSHVMVLPRMGDILTAYMPIRVYQAQPHDGDVDWLPMRGLSHVFYTGEMTYAEVRDLFLANKIDYVFVGPEEKYPRTSPQFYPDILEKIFENTDVTIYKVFPYAFQ